MLLHITSQLAWEESRQMGRYHAPSLETEGFIHCSTPAQVVWVANAFYRGQTGLVLLGIDPQRLHSEVRYEMVEGVPVDPCFPHVYGPINLEAIVRVIMFEPNEQGDFELPASL